MNQGLIERAMERLGPDREPIFRLVAECDGGEWYLKEKIVEAPDDASLLDNTRPLKYAYNFVLNNAKVRFVRETSTPTPDLEVTATGSDFFVEVRKFRMGLDEASSHGSSKIVDAVRTKRRQLPNAGIGFVAIDNFDIRLEPGFGHETISEGLAEVQRLSKSNPVGWRRPSGVILAAASTMGSGPEVHLPPHYVWINKHAEYIPPPWLVSWLVAALPRGELADIDLETEGAFGEPQAPRRSE